jgi:hypothetical protein
MSARTLFVAALLVLAGCARTMLPYKPDPQPPGARISAAYTVVGDRIRVELDTDGKRLEQVWILKPDGTSVAANAVESAPVVATPPPSISIGIGGASWGRHTSVGSSASAGVPVGAGSTHVEGNTIAWFPLAAAGPAPWRVYVKLAGIVPTTVVVGGPIPPR